MDTSTWPPADPTPQAKAAWRERLRADRRALIEAQGEAGRVEQAAALARVMTDWLAQEAVRQGWPGVAGMTVTAYEQMRTEPPLDEFIARARQAGVRVLVPITLGEGRLDWADATDPDRTPLGAQAWRRVDVAFVPALAVDRAGTRMGKGGGYYDRALRELPADTPVVVVLHDHELLDAPLPAMDHDTPVDRVVTAARGVEPARPEGPLTPRG